jgi:hypothetical protein
MCIVVEVCLQNHLEQGFFLTKCIAHNYCSICRVFKGKIGTCVLLRALSGFQSAFMLSKRFIPFYGPFNLLHGALFSCIALLFMCPKCESAPLFIFSGVSQRAILFFF